MASYPKTKYWRSRKHLQSVASLPCQNCGLEGQTQAAHSNMATHGKGRSIKASDHFSAALCFACHHDLDAGHTLTKEQKQKMFLDALSKTWTELAARDLILIDTPDPLLDN
jgi:hypothetical protein